MKFLLCAAFDLFTRNRPDVRNIPADTRERFYDGNNHDHQKRQVNEGCDNRPEKHQDAADTGDRTEDRMHDRRDNVKQEPRATEDDRLHGVKTHEAVAFFENVENDAADQWNAGNGCGHVRGQTSRGGCRSCLWFRTQRRWRLTWINWVWHGLHTQTWRWFVKESSVTRLDFAFTPGRNQYGGP